MVKEKPRLNVRTRWGYRCPRCGNTWSTYTKVYHGYVYCNGSNSVCNHKFKNEKVKYTSYSIWELFDRDTAKEDVITFLEESLNTIKQKEIR